MRGLTNISTLPSNPHFGVITSAFSPASETVFRVLAGLHLTLSPLPSSFFLQARTLTQLTQASFPFQKTRKSHDSILENKSYTLKPKKENKSISIPVFI